ncbi:MAG: 50S ribosomal protein L15 [Bacteroidales bacterium]
MKLHNLKPAKGSVKNAKKIGRGEGSGRGGTSTRGHKGAQSRSGYSLKRGFEGGQMPLQRRVPKFGFKNPNRVEYKVLNLSMVQELADRLEVEALTLDLFIESGLVSRNDKVKVLAQGEVTSKLEISAHAFSKAAIAQIEAKEGKAIVI